MIILVGGEKGGSGKSCLAQNIAVYLRTERNATVLMVDCDPQRTTSDWIHERNNNKKELPGIQCVQLYGKIRNELLSLRNHYDFVIIDMPPSLGEETLSVVAASDWLIIPIQCRFYALDGVERILRVVKRIREKGGAGIRVAGILFAMDDGGGESCRYFSPETLQSLENVVFGTAIPFDPLFGVAAERGMPICLQDVKSEGARAYLELASEIVTLLDKSAKVPE